MDGLKKYSAFLHLTVVHVVSGKQQNDRQTCVSHETFAEMRQYCTLYNVHCTMCTSD